MSSIDQRIVDMQFNNQQFERGIQTSVSSLDKLKKSLKFDDAIKNISNLDKAGKEFSLASMASGIDAIASKFNTLGVIGLTVIQRLTNAVMDFGSRVTSAFTIDPLKQGFDEYEIKMNSIQTLLSNTADKGTTLEDVNKALAELNEYADKTIYNFAQMTDNAAKFTAAGMGLKDAVTNTKGLANVAAGFGVNAEKMAAATYQMTQAMTPGRGVRWEDWRSLQQAGMGGDKLQKEMTKTAKALGKATYENLSFQDSLEKGWLTAEVFTKTMARMAEDPALLKAATNVTTFTKMIGVMKESLASGWATSWEKILGGAEDSKNIWTALYNAFSDVVTASANMRNNMLETWSANGGRSDLIMGIANTFLVLGKVLASVQDAFGKIFPPITSDTLIWLSRKFKELTEWFIISDGTVDKLSRTFQGVFATLDTGRIILSYFVNAAVKMIGTLSPIGGVFLSITSRIGDFLVGLNNILRTFGLFGASTAQAISDLFVNSFSLQTAGIIAKISSSLKDFAGTLQGSGQVIEFIKDKIYKITLILENLGGMLDSAKTKISSFINGFGKSKTVLTSYAEGADSVTASNVKMEGSFDGIKGLGMALLGIFSKLASFISPITSAIGPMLSNLRDEIATTLKGMTFEKAINAISTFINGALFLSLRRLFNVLSENLPKVMEGATGALDAVRDSLKTWQNSIRAKIILDIAIALAILTASIYALSKIDSGVLKRSLKAIGVLFAEMMGAVSVFAYVMNGKVFVGMLQLSIALVGLAASVSILAGALMKLKGLSWDNMWVGLTALSLLLLDMIVVAKAMSGQTIQYTGAALGLIGIALSIDILTKALVRSSSLNWDQLKQGLLTISVALGAMIVIANLVKGTELLQTAVGIAIIAGALHVLIAAIAILGNMSLETVIKGVINITLALAPLVLAMKMIPPGLLGSATGILALAVALNVMISAIAIFGHMNFETIIKGVINITLVLAPLVLAMNLLGGTIQSAIALGIVAGALYLLLIPIKLFGSMDLATIGKGILAIAGAMLALGGVSYVLAALSPVMLTISGSIALFGAGAILASGALVLLATGVALLLPLFASIRAAIPMIGTIMQAFVQEINKVIPMLGDTIDAILLVLVNTWPRIEQILRLFLDMTIQLIVDYTPKITDALFTMGMKAGTYLGEALWKAVDDALTWGAKNIDFSGRRVSEGFGAGITSGTPQATKAANNMSEEVKTTVNDAFEIKSPSKWAFGVGNNVGTTIGSGLKAGQTDAVTAAANLTSAVVATMNSGYKSVLNPDVKTPEVKPKNLLTASYDALVKSLTEGKEKIKGKITEPFKAVTDGFRSVASGVGASGKAIKTAFETFMDGIEERKYYNKISLQEELDAYVSMLKKYGALTDEHKKLDREIYRVKNEIVKKGFETSQKYLDEQKYYNRLTLAQELTYWEIIQKRYLQGSEERTKADREVYRVQQELARDAFQKSLDWIDERQFYGGSMSEKLGYWKILQARYTEDTENHKKADREVFGLQKEMTDTTKSYSDKILDIHKNMTDSKKQLEEDYYAKTKEINDKLKDDVKSVTDEYTNALKSRTETLYSTYSLFEKVEPPKVDKEKQKVLEAELASWQRIQQKYLEGTSKRKLADQQVARVETALSGNKNGSGQELINNLKSQVTELEAWKSSMTSLSMKINEKDLVKELQDAGPKSIEQIKYLNELTAPELDNYVALWRRKHELAKTQAVSELEGLRTSSLVKIEELEKSSATELDKYVAMWKTKMNTLNTETSTQITALNTEWSTKIGEFRSDTENQFIEMVKVIQNELKKLNWSTLENGLNGAYTTGTKTPEAITSSSIVKKGKEALGLLTTLVSGIDLAPTITPVLDTSKLEQGLNTTFSKRSLDVSSIAAKTANIATMSKGPVITEQPSTTNNTKNAEINITNNYTVRSDNDIRNISGSLNNLLQKYYYAQGVAVE